MIAPTEITYFSKLDASMQPALVWAAKDDEPRPLVVCLHTWSARIDKERYYAQYLPRCQERNWHFIFPLFRGPNYTPEACGSDLVVSDLECAVTYMKQTYRVDESKIFLVGGSGGGHASLLMAGRRPELFTAISSWCPISDIAAWFKQVNLKKQPSTKRDYDDHIFEACGGNPLTDEKAAAEAKHRSPLTWLSNATDKVILDIGAGIHDGHIGSVPISHAINAFNEVAKEEDRISEADIAYMVETEKVPEHLRFEGEDVAYGPRTVHFRRVSGQVRLTLFEGGHDMVPGAVFGFFDRQVRGTAPVWNSGDVYDADLDENVELTK